MYLMTRQRSVDVPSTLTLPYTVFRCVCAPKSSPTLGTVCGMPRSHRLRRLGTTPDGAVVTTLKCDLGATAN